MRYDVPTLTAGVLAGERSHIARAITLVESSKPTHRAKARDLLAALAPHTGHAIRVGVSGVPGAGKSTFINAMGSRLVDVDHQKIAILAIDPSSSKTGGSILGDRTRMGELANYEDVFIRPSPSGCHLGGVARATRQAMIVCEAAGYNVILVETVGVGQSEIAVSEMVDTFLFLHVARTGDQLQGIKRGILELADVIAVTKADGDNEAEARISARELSLAMKMISGDSKRRPPVLTCSSMTGNGLNDVWDAVLQHRDELTKSGSLRDRRSAQQRKWLWSLVTEELLERLRNNPAVAEVRKEVEAQLDAETTTSLDGAERILQAFAQEVPHLDWSQIAAI